MGWCALRKWHCCSWMGISIYLIFKKMKIFLTWNKELWFMLLDFILWGILIYILIQMPLLSCKMLMVVLMMLSARLMWPCLKLFSCQKPNIDLSWLIKPSFVPVVLCSFDIMKDIAAKEVPFGASILYGGLSPLWASGGSVTKWFCSKSQLTNPTTIHHH